VLEALAPARRRFVLGMALLALLLVVAVAGAVVVRAVDRAGPVPQSRLGPVVLVAGYGGGTEVFGALLRTLEGAGRETVVVPPVGDNTGDLDAQAVALGDAVDEVLDRTGAPSVDVIGYSAGGVVARLWVRDHGGDGKARRVLTLGSPHHGTDLAGLGAVTGCPTACRQLAPDSPLLARLNAGDETPRGPRWVSVWTTADETVVPPASADLDGALTFTVQSVCPGDTTSHGDLPEDPVVLAAAASVLGAGQPEPPEQPEDVAC
jgi:triacylglycerol esterase/lipase EstA (alpha/beta hydrolase family)